MPPRSLTNSPPEPLRTLFNRPIFPTLQATYNISVKNTKVMSRSSRGQSRFSAPLSGRGASASGHGSSGRGSSTDEYHYGIGALSRRPLDSPPPAVVLQRVRDELKTMAEAAERRHQADMADVRKELTTLQSRNTELEKRLTDITKELYILDGKQQSAPQFHHMDMYRYPHGMAPTHPPPMVQMLQQPSIPNHQHQLLPGRQSL